MSSQNPVDIAKVTGDLGIGGFKLGGPLKIADGCWRIAEPKMHPAK